MSYIKDEALAAFYNWCGEILTDKEQKDDKKTKKICKDMIDTGQQSIMSKEFSKIKDILMKGQ